MAAGPLLLELLVQPVVPAEGCWESALWGDILQNTLYGIIKATGVVVKPPIGGAPECDWG